MNKVEEVVEASVVEAKGIFAANPAIDGIWYGYKDMPLQDLADYAKKIGRPLSRTEDDKLRLQCYPLGCGGRQYITMFIDSVKVQPKKPIVAEDFEEVSHADKA